MILWHLGVEGPHRFSELQRLFPSISHKVLSNQLKELMEDGIVDRTVYPEIPPTELGIPIVEMMYDWGKMRMEQIRNTLEK